MFFKHNIFTILVFSIVLANGLLALFSSEDAFSGLISFTSLEETAYWLINLLALILSIVGGALVLRKKRAGLQICFWVYAIQLLGVVTESYNFVIVVGLYVAWSLDLGFLLDLRNMSVEINLVALLVTLLSIVSLSSVDKTQREPVDKVVRDETE